MTGAASAVLDQTKKPKRSWFQFSLRTFLIATVIFAGLFTKVSIEIASARRKEVAMERLRSRFYVNRSLSDEGFRGGFTSWIPNSVWEKWFPHGNWQHLMMASAKGDSESSSTEETKRTRDVFTTLEMFQSCEMLSLDSADFKSISGEDIGCFRGWGAIKKLDLFGCTPTPSAFRLLSESTALTDLNLYRVGEIKRTDLAAFLAKSPVESFSLQGAQLVGDARLEIRPSLKSIHGRNAGVNWDDASDWLATGRLKTLGFGPTTAPATKPWNSETLRFLAFWSVGEDDLDRLGELPLLESVSFFDCDFKVNGSVSRLSRFPSFTNLRFHNVLNANLIEEIGDIHSLRDLDLDIPIQQCSLVGLAPLLNLESLRISIDNPTERDFETLGSLPRLKTLAIPAPNDLRTMLPILRSTSLERIETWTKGFQGEDEFLRAAGERGIPVFWPSWPDPANAKYLKPKASAPASDETSE